ncbi:hypothetical protein E2P81_ATG03011 [Venturia nashicola]|uniref:Uncharacterized protein n=1 Tax=Venturia nashicola TaxID=86259 RepID=A0A4Z1P908_9PEZI|nr:hypothetical protein E6O75_ATG03075 [Venturia nashicola]TLD36122.1 hypothetical protein E2P81_ATG03011 [Venturia nashicola]
MYEESFYCRSFNFFPRKGACIPYLTHAQGHILLRCASADAKSHSFAKPLNAVKEPGRDLDCAVLIRSADEAATW